MPWKNCCVNSCPNHHNHNGFISFFRPPKDPELFRKWAEILKRHKPTPLARNNSVCELHFKPEEVLREYTTTLRDGTEHSFARGRVALTPGTLPSVFGRKKTDYIEMNAPSKSDKKVTYIFEVGGEDSEDQSVSGDDIEFDDSNEALSFAEEDLSEGESDERKIKEEEGGSRGVAADIEADETVDSDAHMQESSSTTEPFEAGTTAGRTLSDLRQILRPEDDNSIIKNVEEFTRLCRSYIVSKTGAQGRRVYSNKDVPAKKSRVEEEGGSKGVVADVEADETVYSDVHIQTDPGQNIFIYPAKDLDAFSLLYNIDRVKFPSDDWFCTLKDGAPTFLCWSKGYRIHKKVIFDGKKLDPTIVINDTQIKLVEVIKPRSIKEVSSILKLVDSAEMCESRGNPQRERSSCKGYFFRDKEDKPYIKNCPQCRKQPQKPLPPVLKNHPPGPFSFDVLRQAAQDILIHFTNWSVTLLGNSLVFIGWKKSYWVEKLYIVDKDLSIKILFGDQFVRINEIRSPQSIDDIVMALQCLDTCRKCSGIDDLRRAVNCEGYSTVQTMRSRVSRCNFCAMAKKKIQMVPLHGKNKAQRVSRRKNLPPLKLKRNIQESSDDQAEEHEIDESDDEEMTILDIMKDVALPNNSWSSTVVEDAVVFQCWDDSFVVTKKVVIHPDRSVKIYVLENLVEIEAVRELTSVDDTARLLDIVHCVQICDGYDENNRRMDSCTGYFYYADAQKSKPGLPKRCNKCLQQYRVCLKRDWLRLKKVAIKLEDLCEDQDPEGRSVETLEGNTSQDPPR